MFISVPNLYPKGFGDFSSRDSHRRVPLHVGEESDKLPPFVVRFKGRKTTDEVITALIAHSKAVWPDDPVVCEGFDPDAICKCGRRIEEHLKGSEV